jgi:hypothetical protein
MLPAEWEGRLTGTTDSERYLLRIMWRLESRGGAQVGAHGQAVSQSVLSAQFW